MISKNKLKYFASLKLKKNREREDRFLIEGVRLCEGILRSNYEVETILYCPTSVTSHRARSLVERFQKADTPITEIDTKSLQRLTDTVRSQGIVGIVRKREFRLDDLIRSAKMLIATDDINDPGNFGTIIRTAEWFGVGGILTSRNSVEFTNPKVLRASMGATFHLPIIEKLNLSDTLTTLKDRGYEILVTDAHGNDLYSEIPYGAKSVLVLGNEISGVHENIKQMAINNISIPRLGKGESLNVAVATGIILAEMTRQMKGD
ncbi:RNA methyltransferase [candidate division KSB1 bacterium]|nr:RNA methyltransferase [candidate division KSB1 bacterium]